jgi:hypothetical protein
MPTEVSVGSINTIALKIAVQFDKPCNSGKPMLWQSYGKVMAIHYNSREYMTVTIKPDPFR